jgi:hypothetical protein
MRTVFVAAGPHVPEGRLLGEASQLDVAPTVAALLGITMPAAERKALWEAWTEAGRALPPGLGRSRS